MMLNAMAPQRHQQTNDASPLLLATSSPSTSSAATISTSPSSSSSASSHHHQQNHKNHDSQSQSQSINTTNTTTSTANTAISSGSSFNKTPNATPTTTTTTSNHSNHHQHHHHHQQQQHNHFHNNSYQPQRFNHHHNSHHHHNNTSYAARLSNSQRSLSSNLNYNNHHNHNHQHYQHHNHSQSSSGESSIPVTSSTSLSASEVTSITSTTANQRLQQPIGPPHYVDLHVNAGECVSLQLLDGQEQIVAGPATITMISQQQNPPVPIPVQVPPGHMIHQIADENGTLKHIILSVMDTEDGTQLDSTVISLPQGSFRIGELVSTGTGDGGPLSTLPQQAYFANYDGCPVPYEATTLLDTIETTVSTAPVDQTVSVASQQVPDAIATNDKIEQERETEHQVSSYDKSNVETNLNNIDKKEPIINLKQDGKQSNGDKLEASTVGHMNAVSNLSQTNYNVDVAVNDESSQEEIVLSEMSVTSSEAEQMVVPTVISDTSCYPAHSVIANELDLMTGGAIPPIISTVDGQIYSYPQACCCCCYCDPQEVISAGQQPITVPGQQDVVMTTAEHASTTLVGTSNVRMSTGRSSATNLSHTNGAVMTYPGAMIPGGMQVNIGLPTGCIPSTVSMVHSSNSPMQPIASQNSAPVQGNHIPDCSKAHGHHSNKGSRGSNATNGYKQHNKMLQGPTISNNQSGDRQQSYNTSHYSNNHQSYNNVVSGRHYHPTTDVSSSPSFKSQALLPNQGAMMAHGNYSPHYSQYNHVPTTLAAVVSSNKPAHGSQGHQQQQLSATYRTPESDNYMQRTREQVSYSHTNSNYGIATFRSQHNENKRQTLSDKTSNQQHNNRYTTTTTTANVKQVISNNHVISSNNLTSNLSQAGGSVSPMRAKIKGSSSALLHQHHHHHHYQSNGVRLYHYTGSMPQMHESKENNVLSVNPTASNFHSSSRDSGCLNHNVKSSKNNYAHDHIAPISKHINTVPASGNYLSSTNAHKNAGQSNSKFNNQCKNNSSCSEIIDQSIVGPKHMADSLTKNSGLVKDSDTELVSNFNKEAPVAPDNQQVDNCETPSEDNKNFDTRTSRGKQKKCQNQIKNQSLSDSHSDDTTTTINNNNKQLFSDTNKMAKSGFLNESSPQHKIPSSDNDEIISLASDKTLSKTLLAERSGSISRPPLPLPPTPTRAISLKQVKSSQKRTIRDKSSQSGKTNEITCAQNDIKSSECKITTSKEVEGDNNNKPSDELNACTSKDVGGDNETGLSASSTEIISNKESNDSPKSSDHLSDSQQHKNKNNKHNSNQTSASTTRESIQVKNGNSPTQNGSKKVVSPKTAQGVSPKAYSSKQLDSIAITKLESADDSSLELEGLECRLNQELDEDVVLLVSRTDSPTTGSKNQPSITITMRTSLSENNIRALDTSSSSVKSTQTTPQKVAISTTDTGSNNSISSKSSSTEVIHRKKGVDKRKGSNAVKNDQQVKLSSMPQLRLLNLNCTSITSSSVQLRWSYIPSIAEKYGIHHHHSGSKNPALMDHFVVESSSSKNVDTNTLISPKIVYQGCALTCRVNHLSSEKIYHFKVRRTALITSVKGELVNEAAVNGEHLVVSEILSVTLPSIQQSTGKKGFNNSRPNQQRSSIIDSASVDNQLIFGGQCETNIIGTSTSIGASNAYRGNTSSHSNNNHSGHSKLLSQPIKFSNLFKQCRTKFVTMLGKLIQNSLSSYSDTKFAGLLLILFTIFAMLLAIFIHLYIVAPVTE